MNRTYIILTYIYYVFSNAVSETSSFKASTVAILWRKGHLLRSVAKNEDIIIKRTKDELIHTSGSLNSESCFAYETHW